MPPRTKIVLFVTVALGVSRVVAAGDWPQILGPGRNGIAAAEPDLAEWSAMGPRVVWTADLGSGFAGPAVVGNRVVVFHRLPASERVECFDRTSGKSLWRADFPATYPGGVNPDNGPRCVPLIEGDRVFVYGAAGHVHCVSLADGARRWSREAYLDYRGQEGYFGAGTSPLLIADKLLVNVGGRDAGIVAFDAATGKTVWQATDERASYASPITADIDGRTCAVFVTRLTCVAVDPADGHILFQFPFGKTGPTVNAATPLVVDGKLFLSASYEIGARMLTLEKSPREVWANDDTMSSQYTTCVHRDGYLYGIHGREDYRNGELRCFEAATGTVRWRVPGFGVGHLILVGKRLLILTTEGDLVLAEADPQKYIQLARATVARPATRSLPALSRGQLFFRENTEQGGGRLIAVSLE